jgi:hypothetical protein
MPDLDKARAAWDAAYACAEEAQAGLEAAGNPSMGPEFEAWKTACAESRRTSDIWYRIWVRAGRPVSTCEYR